VGHIRHNLEKAFELHLNLMETGSMLPLDVVNGER
jgi:acyl-CoA hydrolase